MEADNGFVSGVGGRQRKDEIYGVSEDRVRGAREGEGPEGNFQLW
jgi:hypothetical protein